MSSPTNKKIFSLIAAAAALAGLAGAGIASTHTANAEPQQYKAPLFGFGSDTTQDVMNALGGFANGKTYTPLVTSESTGYKQIVNFDATIPGGADATARECIATKLGSPLILRPNGSGEGQKILSRQAGGVWYNGLSVTAAITTAACNSSRNVAGLVDFARSSSSVSNAVGTDITALPFGLDALTFAYSKPKTSSDSVCGTGAEACKDAIDTLSKVELTSLYTNGVLLKNSTVLIPCGIQTSSGTYKTWYGNTGNTSSQEGTGTAFCNGIGNGSRLQENHGPELKAKADAMLTTTNAICDGVAGGSAVSCNDVQVVVGFAASAWVSKSNGLSSPAPGTGVSLGLAGGKTFVTYTAGNAVGSKWSPNTDGFNDTNWNRNVYNMVLSANLDNSTGDAAIIEMFKGSTSLMCGSAAQAIVNAFGFLSLGNDASTGCGNTTLKGGLVANG